MEYSFFASPWAEENPIARGRGVRIVGVCPKRLPFALLVRDALVSVLILGCSLRRTRAFACHCLSIGNIHTLCLLISRHSPYIVAQLPILLALYVNELVVVQKIGAIAYSIGRVIGLCVNRAARRLLASDSETLHYPSSEVGYIV
jgi:hypothetical protein